MFKDKTSNDHEKGYFCQFSLKQIHVNLNMLYVYVE